MLVQAEAILRGEMPTRKRPRQFEPTESARPRVSPFQPAAPPSYYNAGAVGPRGGYPFPDQGPNPADASSRGIQWPQQRPYMIPQWRAAIERQVPIPQSASQLRSCSPSFLDSQGKANNLRVRPHASIVTVGCHAASRALQEMRRGLQGEVCLAHNLRLTIFLVL